MSPGVPWDYVEGWPYMAGMGHSMLHQARTLRERAFARLVIHLPMHGGLWTFHLPGPREAVDLGPPDLPTLMKAARRNPGIRARLSNIPIAVGPITVGYDPELHPGLQDLADIIAHEASEAARASYYPRMPEMRVSRRHVQRVMAALQREMDREAIRRRLRPVIFSELPWERQQALAERRRYWFRQFGITARAWRANRWSVWRVADDPLPAWMDEKAL